MDWQLPFFIPSSLTTCRTAQGNAGSETCISINHSTCLPTSVRQVIQSFNPSILKKLTACLPLVGLPARISWSGGQAKAGSISITQSFNHSIIQSTQSFNLSAFGRLPNPYLWIIQIGVPKRHDLLHHLQRYLGLIVRWVNVEGFVKIVQGGSMLSILSMYLASVEVCLCIQRIILYCFGKQLFSFCQIASVKSLQSHIKFFAHHVSISCYREGTGMPLGA